MENIGYGTVVNLFYLPGCIVGGLLMDRIGRKQTMTLGFFCWAILGFIIGGALDPIQKVFPLFVVLYGIFNSFGEVSRPLTISWLRAILIIFIDGPWRRNVPLRC